MKTPHLTDLRPDMGRPHVVLLGAGASLAACPGGDANGRVLPLLKNIVTQCQLDTILMDNGIYDGYDDFESLYSRLAKQSPTPAFLSDIEFKIRSYFAGLRLPPHPTIYDLLILSLRSKDLIATFNWDPLLHQAIVRNWSIVQNKAPTVVYLHGNVAIGVCPKCTRPIRLAPLPHKCDNCGSECIESKLLYPIEKKDYSTDTVIETSWRILKRALGTAYMFTIFGYSAPTSDIDAKSMLLDAWGDKYRRDLEQIDMIDIRPEDEITNLWSDFTYGTHYTHHTDVEKSWLLKNPRRSCESFWSNSMEVTPCHSIDLTTKMSWQELYASVEALIDME